MPSFIVYLLVIFVLFLVAFMSKRHFGRLGFALAVGYVMANSLQNYSDIINRYIGSGVYINFSLVTFVVIILPSLLMMFHGTRYKVLATRIIGALSYAVLGLVLLIDSLSKVVVFQGLGMELFARISDGRHFIILFGLAAAVVDMFITHSSHHASNKKH